MNVPLLVRWWYPDNDGYVTNPHLPALSGWATTPSRHRWGRCDDCGKRRLFLRLYDCFPKQWIDGEPTDDEPPGFWWVCADCLISRVSGIATQYMSRKS